MSPDDADWIELPIQWQKGETPEEFAARKLLPEEYERHQKWLLQYNIEFRAQRLADDLKELAYHRANVAEAKRQEELDQQLDAWRRANPWQAFLNRLSRWF